MFKYFIKGRVQGVGFRYFVQATALRNKLVGTVRNYRDDVEIVVNDKEFMSKMKDLPFSAKIDDYEIDELDEDEKTFKSFEIIESFY